MGGVARIGHDVEEHPAEVPGNGLDLTGGGIEFLHHVDVECRVRSAHPVIGEFRVFVQHQVHIHRLDVAGLLARMGEHSFHDAVRSFSMLVDLLHIRVQVAQDLVDILPVHLAVLLRPFVQLLSQLFDQLRRERGEIVDEVERVPDFVGDPGGKGTQ